MGVLSVLARQRRGGATLRDMRMGLLDIIRRERQDIDPRVVLGGGALAMGPVGAGTAAVLQAYRPWEEQFQRENAFISDAERRQRELDALVRAMNSGT